MIATPKSTHNSAHTKNWPDAIASTAVDVQSSAPSDDSQLVVALRKREENAFASLIDSYQSSLLRLARIYAPSRAIAEEVVQETWVGVLQGLGHFEGRSSLKTWIFRILINRAKTRAAREGRCIAFSQLCGPDADGCESGLEPERFLPDNHPQWPGHWALPPQSWGEDPERILLSKEVQDALKTAIAALPFNQREVITLRDIEQWTSDEVCNVLSISETNQRVLLHRARTKVRAALEKYLQGHRCEDAGLRDNALPKRNRMHHRVPGRKPAEVSRNSA